MKSKVSMRVRPARMRKRRMAAVTGMLALGTAVLVTGCGTSATTAKAPAGKKSSTPSAQTNQGGSIVYALSPQSNITWYLPLINGANDTTFNTEMTQQMYKPLIWIGDGFKIDWKSSIASKITYNKQGTVYHVYLNPKWHWSNGHPVTSKDFLFTWDVIKATSSGHAPAPWPFIGAGTGDLPNGIQSVVANGLYEVTVTLKKPANQEWFIYNGLVQITPLPAASMDKYPDNMMKEMKYLGNGATNPKFDKVVDGPFELVKAVPNQEWVLVPNPHYDGHKSTVHQLIFQYEGSNSAEFSGLKSGTVNYGYLDLSQYGSKGALTSMGDTITPEYSLAMAYTSLNMYPGSKTKKIFDHFYIRKAFQLGIDNSAIAKAVYHGYASPTDGPIPSVPNTQFFDPALQNNPYPYNPLAGKQLLESHGWKEVNGVMTKGNEKLQFVMMYVSGSQAETDEVVLMKEDWAKEGIHVTLKPVPFSTFVSIVEPSQPNSWQIATGTEWFYNGPGYYPTGGQLFATNAPSGVGYSNQKEDALIQASHEAGANAEATLHQFYQYEEYTAKQLPLLWGDNVATLAVHAPNLHGSVQYADAVVGYPQIQYWSVSKSSSSN
ncbi:MAG: peptide ABC transporter substrate-binding protein [Alicyclobacillaceae bacterium]|nr:peptide ABC transporter substrate-binding protein [Alicyclobacillaceae bacterium]